MKDHLGSPSSTQWPQTFSCDDLHSILTLCHFEFAALCLMVC
jgi:hypothetical protein